MILEPRAPLRGQSSCVSMKRPPLSDPRKTPGCFPGVREGPAPHHVRMSKEQQLQLDAILRQGQFDSGGDVQTLRAGFGELMAQVPVAPDVRQHPATVNDRSSM
jgi:hypothetical protein